jgi:uncharacterized HAD superfamily protein
MTPAIVSIQKMECVSPFLNQKSLIAIDLDNTLIQAKSFFGSVEWMKNLTKKIAKKGSPYQSAAQKAFEEWKKKQNNIEVALVEDETLSLLNNWKQNHMIIALTSRDDSLAKATLKQLKSLNIDIGVAKPLQAVVFASEANKGKVLIDFVKNHNLANRQIVAIDDRFHHLKNIETECNNNGLTYHGFHYLAKKPY